MDENKHLALLSDEAGGQLCDDHRPRTRSSSHSHNEGGTTTASSSRHGSITNSSSSACSVERHQGTMSTGGEIGLVCTCPILSTPTTPTTPPTVVCQVYEYDTIYTVACGDASCNYRTSSKDKLGHRKAVKPPRSPRSSNASNKSRKGSSSSSSHGHLTVTGRPPDECGHSAPETDHDEQEESGFEWRWFHRRKHSQTKSRSRSSSHLFGGHSPGRTSGIGLRISPVSSSCCGGRATTGRYDRASSPEQDAVSEVYGGDGMLDPSSIGGDTPSGTTFTSTVARNGLRQGKKTAKNLPQPTSVSAVINPGQAYLVLIYVAINFLFFLLFLNAYLPTTQIHTSISLSLTTTSCSAVLCYVCFISKNKNCILQDFYFLLSTFQIVVSFVCVLPTCADHLCC
ncbi:uncharacterized protein LOC125769333 [Anopheles funestus]|uniref:uncharacterized protein LOC125769333 n=1 Tax=Anopheles funestus TaxID=62324 RepID=UPI0020C6B4DE|nr:uncharacterized protein LOC125769333 [Anopheles funestus]